MIHLHNHSEYSLLDGLGKPEQYAKRAKELNMKAIAITDHGNIDGAIKWQKACKDQGVKSIIGCELYLVPDVSIKQKEQRRHIVLLVRNQEGWKSLLKMITISNLEGFYNRPRVDYNIILNNINDGLIVSIACENSFIHDKNGIEFLKKLRSKTDCFLEIMPHLSEGQSKTNNLCIELSKQLELQLIATNDCHYVLEEQTKAQEILLAIQRKAKWTDKNRFKFNIDGLYLRSKDEMIEQFKKQNTLSSRQYNIALMNTEKVAELCWDFKIQKQDIDLPVTKFEKQDTSNAIDIIDHFCKSTLYENVSKIKWTKEYQERYQREYEIIKKKNFARYILVIYELTQWCKENDIPHGVGRGSSAGSLILYLLGITGVDPLKFGLLFERFISDDRLDFPDVDIDFDKNKIPLIKQHLEQEYGKYNVAGISTFMTMQAKAVVRDIGRVFDLNSTDVDEFAKSLNYYDSKKDVVLNSIQSKEGTEFKDKYPEQFEACCDLEGRVRGCVDGDCRVLLPNSKGGIKNKTIRKLFEEKYRDKIRCFDLNRNLLYFENVSNVWESGIKPVYKITLTEGLSINLTDDHRLLTKDGWKKAKDIKIGEFIATNGTKRLNSGLFKKGMIPWNKGKRGLQKAWNKGLTKDIHWLAKQSSERMKKDNPMKLEHNKKNISEKSFKHGKFSIVPIYKNNHPICEICGNNKTQEIHHLDKNILNNNLDNLIATCIKCHHKIHWDLKKDKQINKTNPLLTIKWNKVICFEFLKNTMTYDIKMEGKYQNFVCNKIICHNSGQHPAGIIISGQDLRNGDRCSLSLRNNAHVINWDMQDSEHAGLIKIDILKLSTLSIINKIKKLIIKNHGKYLFCHPESDCYFLSNDDSEEQCDNLGEFDFNLLSLDDKKVFDLLSKGKTSGIFQLTGHACTKLCLQMGIDNFNDIAIAVSISRPGPMDSGMAEKYINRKHGEEWEKIHPIYEDITKETKGVIVYQEQIMKVMTDIAGLSGNYADKIRKIIGKKRDVKEFEPYKNAFIDGCKKQKTLTEKQADEFWEGLKKHASYSFNKCVSKNTYIKRICGNKHNRKFSVEEMYKIKNDIEYARKTGHINLHGKFIYNKHYGYGLSLNDDKRIRKNIIRDIQQAGIRKLYKVTLENNSFIDVTISHKFPVNIYEEKTLSELNVGDYLFFCEEYEKTKDKYNFSHKKQVCKGKKYGNRCGFPTGSLNPGYTDGGYSEYIKNKNKLDNACDICGKINTRIETHHKNEDRNNNSIENLQNLCASCHKKQHYKKGRTKQGEKGYPSKFIKIISIEYIGEEMTYNITMDAPYHNFVTDQGIVTSNSHAVSYALIAYWTAWAKVHYPGEFICSSLTYGDEGDKEILIKEAQDLGIKIVTPKVKYSHPTEWIFSDNTLYMPFTEIKGIGETEAEKCLQLKPIRKGFFAVKPNSGSKGNQIQKTLEDIKAFDDDKNTLPENPSRYFQFEINKLHIDKNIKIERKSLKVKPNAINCKDCDLRRQAKQVVLSSPGLYNALIIAEAPGSDEDNEGIGLIGRSGDLLWSTLSERKITRRMINVSNACKCFPSETKTPTQEQAENCFNKWLIDEIKSMDCKLVLGLGGIVYNVLTSKKSGITKAAGTIEWIDKINSWVVWSVHPSFVLRSRSKENIELFEKGIKLFSEKFLGNI